MQSRDFCYWLQGFFEIGAADSLTASQLSIVKAHLALVFKHEIDPSIDGGDTAKKNVLDHLHNQGLPSGPVMRC